MTAGQVGFLALIAYLLLLRLAAGWHSAHHTTGRTPRSQYEKARER